MSSVTLSEYTNFGTYFLFVDNLTNLKSQDKTAFYLCSFILPPPPSPPKNNPLNEEWNTFPKLRIAYFKRFKHDNSSRDMGYKLVYMLERILSDFLTPF